MNLSARVTAGITGTFLAATVLATSGFVNAPASGRGMAAMEMESVAVTGQQATAAGALAAGVSTTTNPPCETPCGQEICRSMVGCAPVAIVSAQAEPGSELVSFIVVAAAVLAPTSESPAPELPPPRA